MAFRFVHTADLHLDSPLRSLALRNGELAALVGDGTRQALMAIVSLCLEERVDALLIAGDLYDGDQTSMKTARFLASQMQRLQAGGIQVFKIRGNHDALSRITQELVLPPNVKVFGGRAETVQWAKEGLTLAIHGLSFAKPQAPESLLGKFRPPVADAVNIGLMHTSLDGSRGHDVYAPCALADLQASGFAYWALGHIHQRSHHRGATTVVMPGMPQGRDINEAGPKTVSLVTIGDEGSITVEERLTGLAQFERIPVDLEGESDWRGAVARIDRALATVRDTIAAPHLVARLQITGRTPLAWRLRRDRDLLLAEAEQRGESLGRTWIEKADLAVSPPLTAEEAAGPAGGDVPTGADPVAELEALMRDVVLPRSGFRETIGALVKDLVNDLPPDCRRLAGEDEADFETFLDGLMRRGAEDMAARMRAVERGDD